MKWRISRGILIYAGSGQKEIDKLGPTFTPCQNKISGFTLIYDLNDEMITASNLYQLF